VYFNSAGKFIVSNFLIFNAVKLQNIFNCQK